MAKFAFAIVVLVALLAVQASSSRTIITTRVEDQNQQWGPAEIFQRCQQQVQQSYFQLQPCRQFLQQNTPFTLDMYENQFGMQYILQCCQQLRNFGPQCACEAVRQVAREQLMQQGQGQGGWGQGIAMQQTLLKARNLPRMCQIQMGECEIQTPYQ